MREAGQEIITRALVRPRRPVNGKVPLLKLFQPNAFGGVLRWDEKFLRPGSPIGEHGVREFGKAIEQCVPIVRSLLKPGDTLIIDNWRMLHARAAVPADCNARHIERTYLESLS
ncbi:MAG: TauD/TfdA family dioxygenase [Geminicoccales bacterium]